MGLDKVQLGQSFLKADSEVKLNQTKGKFSEVRPGVYNAKEGDFNTIYKNSPAIQNLVAKVATDPFQRDMFLRMAKSRNLSGFGKNSELSQGLDAVKNWTAANTPAATTKAAEAKRFDSASLFGNY